MALLKAGLLSVFIFGHTAGAPTAATSAAPADSSDGTAQVLDPWVSLLQTRVVASRSASHGAAAVEMPEPTTALSRFSGDDFHVQVERHPRRAFRLANGLPVRNLRWAQFHKKKGGRGKAGLKQHQRPAEPKRKKSGTWAAKASKVAKRAHNVELAEEAELIGSAMEEAERRSDLEEVERMYAHSAETSSSAKARASHRWQQDADEAAREASERELLEKVVAEDAHGDTSDVLDKPAKKANVTGRHGDKSDVLDEPAKKANVTKPIKSSNITRSASPRVKASASSSKLASAANASRTASRVASAASGRHNVSGGEKSAAVASRTASRVASAASGRHNVSGHEKKMAASAHPPHKLALAAAAVPQPPSTASRFADDDLHLKVVPEPFNLHNATDPLPPPVHLAMDDDATEPIASRLVRAKKATSTASAAKSTSNHTRAIRENSTQANASELIGANNETKGASAAVSISNSTHMLSGNATKAQASSATAGVANATVAIESNATKAASLALSIENGTGAIETNATKASSAAAGIANATIAIESNVTKAAPSALSIENGTGAIEANATKASSAAAGVANATVAIEPNATKAAPLAMSVENGTGAIETQATKANVSQSGSTASLAVDATPRRESAAANASQAVGAESVDAAKTTKSASPATSAANATKAKAQATTLTPIAPGTYYVINSKRPKYLSSLGVNISMYKVKNLTADDRARALQWRFDPVAGKKDTYHVVNVRDQSYLNALAGSVQAWSPLHARDAAKGGPTSLTWKLKAVAGSQDTYFFVNEAQQKYMDTFGFAVSTWRGKSLEDLGGQPGNIQWQLKRAHTAETQECEAYVAAKDPGCLWTGNWSCPAQSAGVKGIAGSKGGQETIGFRCCCNMGLWAAPFA